MYGRQPVWCSVVTDEFILKVYQVMDGKCLFMISDFSDEFHQISRTGLFQIVTDRLGCHKFCVWWDRLGYCRFCVWWIPKQLSDVHKAQIRGSALMFLLCCWEEEDKYLSRIMTGDQFMNVEVKEQRMHTKSPDRPKKFKYTFFFYHHGNWTLS